MRKVLITLFFSIFLSNAEACTSFHIKTEDRHVFYARTLEGETDFQSSLTIIPKGTPYVGTLPDGSHNGLAWTSKYGIVGITALGRPLLMDGINEKGLAGGSLLFPGFAEYQPFDAAQSKQTLAQWEFLTWILTNCATVDEVRTEIQKVRVSNSVIMDVGSIPLHFVVHDRQGNCLVIEHTMEQMHVYENPLSVMTNSPPFDWHLINLRNFINISATNVKPLILGKLQETGLGQGTGMLGLPGDYTPPSRFVRMVALTSSALPVNGLEEGLNLAMTIIDNVDIPLGVIRDVSNRSKGMDRTFWTAIGDLDRGRYYIRTYANKNWKMVDVSKALSKRIVQSIELYTPPLYQDVTDTAKPQIFTQ
jgi:choloylglycine hydrolase